MYNLPYILSFKAEHFIIERYSVNHGSALKMRDIGCRSLLRLQENFATRSKPRVQATVAASCSNTYFCSVCDRDFDSSDSCVCLKNEWAKLIYILLHLHTHLLTR